MAADTCREIAEILVQCGANVSMVDFVGYTPLLVCCSTGRYFRSQYILLWCAWSDNCGRFD